MIKVVTAYMMMLMQVYVKVGKDIDNGVDIL